MRNKSRFVYVAAIAVMALAFAACSSSTEPELTLEDLIAQLQIQLGATNTGGGSASSAFAGAPRTNNQDPRFQTPPTENMFQVRGPNTNVFGPNWPIIDDIPITAEWASDEDLRMFWPYINEEQWPDLEVAGGVRFGNTWIVFPEGGNPNSWVAQHTEWIRSPHERTGTIYPLIPKLLGPEPCADCPVGQFIAGPSRHVPDIPLYQRRTVIKWFRWGDMSPWVWPDDGGGGGGGDGEGENEPVLTEAHVYILGLSAELEGGTQVDFPLEVGDVDLMTLDGQVKEVVDSEVPRGTFNNVKFVVDEARSFVVVDGEQLPLLIGERTVTVVGPFVVGDEPITTITLQFDVMESLTDNGDGTWTLNPVITVIVTTG